MITVGKHLAFSKDWQDMALDLSWECKRGEMDEWTYIIVYVCPMTTL